MIVAADVKGNDITFLTDEPIWEEFRLDSIIAAVDHTPKINPWQWQNGEYPDYYINPHYFYYRTTNRLVFNRFNTK